MTDPRAQEILREALEIASGQKSGTTTAETEHVRAIGRYSADLLYALIWLEDISGLMFRYAKIVAEGKDSDFEALDAASEALDAARTFAHKVIHAAGGLTIAEEQQQNWRDDQHREHAPEIDPMDAY
jgi:hypothetical protein